MTDDNNMYCMCGKFKHKRRLHCPTCYQLYIKRKMYINGQWWHVKTEGIMDVFAIPALNWHAFWKVEAPNLEEDLY